MLRLSAGASIITTTSVEAFNQSPMLLDYAATKGTIMNFTKAFAKQAASKGIRVNSVAPGPFGQLSKFLEDSRPKTFQSSVKELRLPCCGARDSR